jgi:Tol biopolymer transport system component
MAGMRPEPIPPDDCTKEVTLCMVRVVATALVLAPVASAFAARGDGTPPLRGESTSTSSSRILFWSGRGGFPAIWVMSADGSGPRLLSRFPQNAKRGVLSPDGRRVAFDGAARGIPAMTNFDIQVMNVDGTHRMRLTTSPAYDIDAQWSPDGSQISYTHQLDNSGRDVSIWLIKPDGTGKHKLAIGGEARWAPNGERILFSRWQGAQTDLFLLDLDSGAISQLTATPVFEEPGGWSPDGKSIVFTRDSAAGNRDVYAIDADGSDVRRLTRGPAEDAACNFSPDGRQIVFTSNRTGHHQVFVMNANGSRQRNLSRSTSDDEATQWHR